MKLKYGNKLIDVPTDGLDTVVVERTMSDDDASGGVKDLKPFIDDKLEDTGFPNFIYPGDSVAIVVPDKTRYAMTEKILPIVLDRLNDVGVPDDRIEVTYALGIHTPQIAETQRCIIGEEAAQRIQFADHYPQADGLAELGETSRGTPVRVNRRVMERDKIITLGSILYHYFAGFGGGRKMLIPGVAAPETCRANHILALTETGRHPEARAGRLDGNPVYDDGIEALRRITVPIFSINAVLAPDKRLLGLFCGDPIESHRRACEFYDARFRVEVPGPAPAAIVSAGGAPKDINWIQSHKAVEMAYQAMRPGGAILALLECPEGVGHSDFLGWFDHPDLGAMRRVLGADYQIYGQTAWNTRFKAEQCEIFLLSELPGDVVWKMGMTPVESIEEGMKKIREHCRPGEQVLIFPHGSTYLPTLP